MMLALVLSALQRRNRADASQEGIPGHSFPVLPVAVAVVVLLNVVATTGMLISLD